MNRIAEVFGSSHVLLPVVHPISREAALAAIQIAHDVGVKGVFLIDQGMDERDVLALVREVRDRFPALWIGVNLLTRRSATALTVALETCGTIDGIWADNAGVDDHGVAARADDFVAARRAASWNGMYFGGVAFKYQHAIPPQSLGRVTEAAAAYMDVICTSGPGTGYAADLDKVRIMREGVGGDHAMALASGITPDNVRSYMPYVQAFLVGTGIEEQLGVFDPAKIEALMRAMEGGS